jgi:magnesium-transporting ATPase (P-type)
VMQRPPRTRNERLLSLPTLLRAYGWLGLIEAGLALSGYFFAYWLAGWRPGTALAETGVDYLRATTMSFAGIVACQAGNVLACRSIRESVLRVGFGGNPTLLLGIGVEFALLTVLIYVPPLAVVFGLVGLGPWHWFLLATFGPLLLLLEEGRKTISRWKAGTQTPPCRSNR